MSAPNGSMSLGSTSRADRIGPTSGGTSDWKKASRRGTPPSTTTSITMSAESRPSCGREFDVLSILAIRIFDSSISPSAAKPVSGHVTDPTAVVVVGSGSVVVDSGRAAATVVGVVTVGVSSPPERTTATIASSSTIGTPTIASLRGSGSWVPGLRKNAGSFTTNLEYVGGVYARKESDRVPTASRVGHEYPVIDRHQAGPVTSDRSRCSRRHPTLAPTRSRPLERG